MEKAIIDTMVVLVCPIFIVLLAFLFLWMKFVKKSILGPKWELTQNVRIKSVFSPQNYKGIMKKLCHSVVFLKFFC